jgi:hypothetical protein
MVDAVPTVDLGGVEMEWGRDEADYHQDLEDLAMDTRGGAELP